MGNFKGIGAWVMIINVRSMAHAKQFGCVLACAMRRMTRWQFRAWFWSIYEHDC